jgi:hypothetical protein
MKLPTPAYTAKAGRGHVPVNKNRMVFLSQKGNNIVEKWIREVLKGLPYKSFDRM